MSYCPGFYAMDSSDDGIDFRKMYEKFMSMKRLFFAYAPHNDYEPERRNLKRKRSIWDIGTNVAKRQRIE